MILLSSHLRLHLFFKYSLFTYRIFASEINTFILKQIIGMLRVMIFSYNLWLHDTWHLTWGIVVKFHLMKTYSFNFFFCMSGAGVSVTTGSALFIYVFFLSLSFCLVTFAFYFVFIYATLDSGIREGTDLTKHV